ncbi:hypothetical protein ANMWB30_24160 [Arthrobacter sp. MWB30]|nr:hypothetical protein ANMWB30_24160 [Arthrobacter sp. MWB30]
MTDSVLGFMPTGYGIDASGKNYSATHEGRSVSLHYEVQDDRNILFMDGVRLTPAQ